MSSSSPPCPTSNGNGPQVPPSGNGLTKETAQHTAAFSKNTSETSYVVHRMLKSIKWLQCTKDEAKHWEDIGYDIFDAAGRKTSLDILLFGDQPEVDPAAFATHFDEVASAEHALEAASADEKSQSPALSSSSSTSGGSDEVFDKPETAGKSKSFPEGKDRGAA
ncbi:hypothetical protein SLS59_002803 [Nothophoma quercina]|uniref:Uncharacterized protein n=1 Tax=Nothophoma quercina TaxID=749835 RepID=A0ABR3RRQ0_9PLEO